MAKVMSYHFSDYITKDCGFSVISTLSCAGTFFRSALGCSNEKGCHVVRCSLEGCIWQSFEGGRIHEEKKYEVNPANNH